MECEWIYSCSYCGVSIQIKYILAHNNPDSHNRKTPSETSKTNPINTDQKSLKFLKNVSPSAPRVYMHPWFIPLMWPGVVLLLLDTHGGAMAIVETLHVNDVEPEEHTAKPSRS